MNMMTARFVGRWADAQSDAADLAPVRSLPRAPWAFLWHFVRRYFWRRYLAMIVTVLVAQGLDTFEPYVLKRMINALTDTVNDGAPSEPIMTWFAVAVAVWAS
jgi:ABC-type multidrug transport system fused ATPase/permease subunit